tara:strand:+ start:634 stop:1167 length:534 start_codon:yes stop_codon:yes gene_type:complete
MIESRYWREDLRAHARRLRSAKNPPRWSERAVVNFEKELMISFFMIRILLEHKKTSSKSQNYQVPVHCAPWNGKLVTQLNFWDVDELYHFEKEVDKKVSLPFLANQFIHSKIIYTLRDTTRNWSEVLLCSDFEIKKSIYRISVEEIRKVFILVSQDYAHRITYEWDPKRSDYHVTSY